MAYLIIYGHALLTVLWTVEGEGLPREQGIREDAAFFTVRQMLIYYRRRDYALLQFLRDIYLIITVSRLSTAYAFFFFFFN